MNGRDSRDVRFLLAAIENCAVHPKFLGDEVTADASVREDYLCFSEQLHWFIEEVEGVFAARGHLSADFVEEKWRESMSDTSWEEPPYRIAQTYVRILMKKLRDIGGS
jgi:hypothetical protein